MCANLDTFHGQTSEQCIKPGSELLFDFVDKETLTRFNRGNFRYLFLSFYEKIQVLYK